MLAVVHGEEVARQAQEGHAPRSRRHHYGGTCATISYSSACQRQVLASFFAAYVAFRVDNHELLRGRSCNDFFLIFSSGFSSVQAPDIKRHPKKNSKSHSEHIHESLSDSASAVPGLFPLQRNQGNSRHFSPKSHEVADRGFARFPELLISNRFRPIFWIVKQSQNTELTLSSSAGRLSHLAGATSQDDGQLFFIEPGSWETCFPTLFFWPLANSLVHEGLRPLRLQTWCLCVSLPENSQADGNKPNQVNTAGTSSARLFISVCSFLCSCAAQPRDSFRV